MASPGFLGIKWGRCCKGSHRNMCRDWGSIFDPLCLFPPKTGADLLQKLVPWWHCWLKPFKNELKTLNKNNIRLEAIGRTSANCRRQQKSFDGRRWINQKQCAWPLSWPSTTARWEIVQASRQYCGRCSTGQAGPRHHRRRGFSQYLSTRNIPDPELLIRTSGEQRISNYLLWQIAMQSCILRVFCRFPEKTCWRPFWIIRKENADLAKHPNNLYPEQNFKLFLRLSTTASHTSLSLTIGSAIYRTTMINYRFIFLLVWSNVGSKCLCPIRGCGNPALVSAKSTK